MNSIGVEPDNAFDALRKQMAKYWPVRVLAVYSTACRSKLLGPSGCRQERAKPPGTTLRGIPCRGVVVYNR